MDSSNDFNPPTMRATPPQQISVLDIFVPGFTHASLAFQQLLAEDVNIFAHLVCFFGMLGFLSTYTCKLGSWLEQYLSEFSLQSVGALS